jgi:hypothetical protein
MKLTYYNPEVTIASGVDSTYDETHTGTITNTTTLTISGGTILPSAIVDGSVFEITRSSGTADNVDVPALVKTAGNNLVVVMWDTPWTNEATKDYEWKTYTSYDFLWYIAQTKTTQHIPFDLGGLGYRVPNLSLETISGGSYVYIYT